MTIEQHFYNTNPRWQKHDGWPTMLAIDLESKVKVHSTCRKSSTDCSHFYACQPKSKRKEQQFMTQIYKTRPKRPREVLVGK